MSATIVAESLAVIPDLVRDALQPGDRGAPRAVAAAIARAGLPGEAIDNPPPWLEPAQARSFRRALYAMRRAGGALLATAVGSGKTYVALAVAEALRSGGPVDVIAPAVLGEQWREVAQRLGIALRVTSHERVSRGDVAAPVGVVVIDESHRFRNPATRRYQTLAPLLVGRPVLLVSATPVVNRLGDLLHQLLLAVRDDALLEQGIVSLRRALAAPPVSPALAQLVIAETEPADERPSRRDLVVNDWQPDNREQRVLLAALDRLRLSLDPGIAALIRTSLLRASASSPAALLASLRRLGLLLEHAYMAHRSGRRVGRREVERAVGAIADQLVMWGVVPDADAPAELALSDRGPVARLTARVRRATTGPDPKLALLRTLVGDHRPTVVFAAATETVHYLRRRLGAAGVAWVTGTKAGIDRCRYPRQLLLRLFDPASGATAKAPWLLIASDVAAEGLNLQRVSRVVHYDLPWTQVRLDQRDGRAIRLGSTHPEVSIIRFDPPPGIDTRLMLLDRVGRKASLPGAVGLGAVTSSAWTWQRRLREAWRDEPGEAGWAAVESLEAGAAAAVSIEGATRSPIVMTLARSADGAWSDDPALFAAVLEAARHGPAAKDGRIEIDRALDELAGAVKQRLRVSSGLALSGGTSRASRAAARVAWRALRIARRDRREDGVLRADRALAVLRGGLTAGEERLAALAAGGNAAAMDRLTRRPVAPTPTGPPRIRLLGVVVLAPPPDPGLHQTTGTD